MMRIFLFLLLLLCLGIQTPKAEAAPLESSILRVYSYVQRPDYDAPWTTKASERLVHLAMVIDKKSLLVSAYATRSARHFEAEKIGDSKRYPLQLKFVDPIANLAILEFVDGTPEDIEAVSFGEDLELGSTCTIYEGVDGESLVPRSIRLREVELKQGVLTSYPLPQYSLEIRKPGFGWFEPLIRSGKVVGAAVSQSGSSVYALPVSLIKRVIEEVKSDSYRGFAELGISFSPLLSPALRNYSKADGRDDGVYIQDIKSNSPFADALKPGDILLELDKTPVSARGSYDHPLWGRLSIVAKLSEFHAGDSVDIEVLRDGKTMSVERKLTAYDPNLDRLPSSIDDAPVYLIYGGLVIQELTEGLLQSWGPSWRKRAPLPYLIEDQYHSWARGSKRERIVVLQRVLALDFNKGYHDLEDYFVSEVNGQPIHDLGDVEKALANPEKPGFARFSIEPGHEEIILSSKNIKRVHAALRQRYGIPAQARFWEPSVDEVDEAPAPKSKKKSAHK